MHYLMVIFDYKREIKHLRLHMAKQWRTCAKFISKGDQ